MKDLHLERIEKKENYGQKIYLQIKNLIICGKLEAGSTINEREYSEILGVSRTPLREALALLEKEGWIEQSGKTRKVSFLLWKDVLELVELREPLDMIGFRLAFDKYTEEDFAHFRYILQQMAAAAEANSRDYFSIMALDTSFHQFINFKSGNSLLFQISNDLNEKTTRCSVLSMTYGQEKAEYYIDEHQKILCCIEERNLEKACRQLSMHYESWKRKMRSLPQQLGFDPADRNAPIKENFVEINK